MIRVLRAGALTTIQDRGRHGYASMGVPPSGAADQRSMRLANRLVGNAEWDAVLETTLSGPSLRFEDAALFAVTGAEASIKLDCRDLAMNAPRRAEPGQELRLGEAHDGARTYIAVQGGFDGPMVLGSRSTDLLTGLGPPPLRAGDRLRVGGSRLSMPTIDVAPTPPLAREPELRVVLGPRCDLFTPDAIDTLLTASYSVDPSANRIGARLHGPVLERHSDDELLSEGLVAGALQIPPSGQPILLLSDHPVTGGYPVIATVIAQDLPIAGQLRPGQRLRFKTVPSPTRFQPELYDHGSASILRPGLEPPRLAS